MNAENKVIKTKIGMLQLAQKLGNVSEACKTFGYSRDSFYRIRDAFEIGGEQALMEISRKKPLEKNRVEARIEGAVMVSAVEQPGWGQLRTSNELKKSGIMISPGGVRSIWMRHDMETMKKRLVALETKVAQEGGILTEAQLIAFEKRKAKNEATGEIETHHPGYLGSQDTYYVGNVKGVGRIYQQTYVDTYSKHADAKLYTEKNGLVAADMLNERVLPFYEQQEVKIDRIMTDRGTEFCGVIEHHPYELYLAVEGIEHTKTKAYSPQTNGICERFHKTIGNEFYAVAFRRKMYATLQALQDDLDLWLLEYNTQRTHQGRYCFGKTPYQTFLDARALAREKQVTHYSNPSGIEPNLVLEQPPRTPVEVTDRLFRQGVGVERSETTIPLTKQAVAYTEGGRPAATVATGHTNSIGHSPSPDTVR